MTRCTDARQRANAALLVAAAAAVAPWAALAAEAGALPSASSAPVAVARPDLRCTQPPPRGPRRPGPPASTVTVGSVRFTVACVDADAATVIPEPGRPPVPTTPGSGTTGPGPAGPGTSGSGSGGAPPLPPPTSTPRPVDPQPSASAVDTRTTTTTVDWFVRASALLGQLVTLALAVACGLLAWAAFVVLREALGMAPQHSAADQGAGSDAKPDPAPPNVLPGTAAPSKLPAPAPQPFTFQRHWGGFGGASTGWVLSERLVRVIVGLVLGALAAALGMQLVPHETASAKAEIAAGSAASAPKSRD